MLALALSLMLAAPVEKYKTFTDKNECLVTKYSAEHRQREHLPKGAYAYLMMIPLQEQKVKAPYVFGLYDFEKKEWTELNSHPPEYKPKNMEKEANECVEKALKTEPLKAK